MDVQMLKIAIEAVAESHTEGHNCDVRKIWSRALFDIHDALGRRTADRIILQAQFGFGVDPSFAEAARATVDAATLIAGSGAAVKFRKAFEDRGIL